MKRMQRLAKNIHINSLTWDLRERCMPNGRFYIAFDGRFTRFRMQRICLREENT